MPAVTVREHEMLEFFGVIPKMRDADVPWMYNDALYEVTSHNVSVSLSLAPSYKSVNLILSCSGTKLYELNANGVQDVLYRKGGERESLEIRISGEDSLFLFLSPAISLYHGAEERA